MLIASEAIALAAAANEKRLREGTQMTEHDVLEPCDAAMKLALVNLKRRVKPGLHGYITISAADARAALTALQASRNEGVERLVDALEEARDEFDSIKESADDDDAFLCWQAAKRGIEQIDAALSQHIGGGAE